MAYKKLSLLLLLALVSITAYAHEDFDPWQCNHDQGDQEEAVVNNEIDEGDYNPEGNDHSDRTLQSYGNLRTYGYYGALASTPRAFRSYLENDLIPPILDYFSGALRIKYPVNGPLKFSENSLCGVPTPAILKTGVNADYVFIVNTNNNAGYVASSSACSLAPATTRPLAGRTTISTGFMSATTDTLLHERNMVCIMHEIIHTLGFTNGMYTWWLDYKTGRKLGNPTTTARLGGANAVVIEAEPIRTMLRNYFGCPSLLGAYMENSGSSGTAGSHFERRQFAYEGMTSGLIYQMQFSQFTLGMLESTGWYAPDYSYADPFYFGQGEGCGFLTGACTAGLYSDICAGSGRGCTTPGRGGANCANDVRSDNCRFWQPEPLYDCENVGAESYARLPSIQSFGRGANSKCFTGTLSSSSAGSSTSFCFKYSCTGSGVGTQLTVHVGGQDIVCNAAGPKGVSGFGGSINCPDPLTFCSTVGQKICPRGCMGRGTCVNGVCNCKPGFKGTDCALNA